MVPPIPGLHTLKVGDIISLDPSKLRGMRLDALLDLMRRCGLSTQGVDSKGAAATRLVERGMIEG